MNIYENCSFEALEHGGFVFNDLVTPLCVADNVYIGAGGVYVVAPAVENPSALYAYFRNLLGVSRIRLFFVGKGEYKPVSDSFAEPGTSELQDIVSDFLYGSLQQYSQMALERMKDALIKSDARERGCYTDRDGVLYLYRNNEFHRASELDSERVFKLCLFGGVFGLHRFALGKWVSGLVYVFTCGLFLLGWVCDLVQLFFGFQKDKRKRLLRPLQDRKHKLRYLPIGVIVGCVALGVWMQMFKVTTDAGTNFFVTNSPLFSSFLQRLF